MANILNVQHQQAILVLAQQGRSIRQIAKELGLHRKTVRRYFPAPSADPKCTTDSTTGSEGKCTTPTAGKNGPESLCLPWAALIEEKLRLGLTAQRIHQDLQQEVKFEGSYQAVKRFVHRLRKADPTRVWRIESAPGEEVQVDFGLGAPLLRPEGRKQRTWVLRMVLSYSRKAYSEAVLRQDTETFIRELENGFRALGGVPLTLNLDNLKAAVLRWDRADPELNPKLAAFAKQECDSGGKARQYKCLSPLPVFSVTNKGKTIVGIAIATFRRDWVEVSVNVDCMDVTPLNFYIAA